MRALNYSIWYIDRDDSRVVYFDSLVVTNCLEQGRVLGEQSIKLVHPSASRYTDLNARYWVLPMNINQCHWNLAVYDRNAIQPVLYWLDSLSSPATNTTSDVTSLATPFRSLPCILDYKLSAPLPVIHLPVRTQTHGSSCGDFTIAFAVAASVDGWSPSESVHLHTLTSLHPRSARDGLFSWMEKGPAFWQERWLRSLYLPRANVLMPSVCPSSFHFNISSVISVMSSIHQQHAGYRECTSFDRERVFSLSCGDVTERLKQLLTADRMRPAVDFSDQEFVRHSAMKEGGVLVYSAMLDGVRCPAGCGWDEQLSTSLAAHRRYIPAGARKPTSLQPSSLYKCVEYVSANDHDLTLSSPLYHAADVFRGLRHTPARRIEAFQQRVLTNELMVWFETNGPSSTLPHMDMTGGISSMVGETGRKLIGWWDLADRRVVGRQSGRFVPMDEHWRCHALAFSASPLPFLSLVHRLYESGHVNSSRHPSLRLHSGSESNDRLVSAHQPVEEHPSACLRYHWRSARHILRHHL